MNGHHRSLIGPSGFTHSAWKKERPRRRTGGEAPRLGRRPRRSAGLGRRGCTRSMTQKGLKHAAGGVGREHVAPRIPQTRPRSDSDRTEAARTARLKWTPNHQRHLRIIFAQEPIRLGTGQRRSFRQSKQDRSDSTRCFCPAHPPGRNHVLPWLCAPVRVGLV